MRAVIRIAQLARTIIIARILVPADFGLMAFATIAVLMIEMLSRTGFRHALVQREGSIGSYLDTAWTIEVIRGIVMAAILAIGAPLVGTFFGSPDVVPLVRVLAVGVAITGFTNMALVDLDRNLEFNKVFRFEVSQRATEALVGIVAAIILQSVWALVIAAITGSLVRVVVSFVLVPRRPRFEIIRSRALELYRFGRWIYGTTLLGFFSTELDDILVGRMYGEAALGLYRMAFTLSQSVVTEIAQTTNQVVFSAFSRLQERRSQLSEALIHSAHFVAFLSFPAATAFVIAGPDIIRVLLGEKWMGMVTPMQILAIAGAVRSISVVIGIIFEGSGQPELTTRIWGVRLVVLAVLVYPLTRQWELEGAALAVLAASTVAGVLMMWTVVPFTGGRYGALLQSLAWPLVNSLFMGAVVAGFIHVSGGAHNLLHLALVIIVGVGAYGVAVIVSARFFSYREPANLVARLKQR